MAPHPDLQAEQDYIDRAYDSLEAMRRAARQRMRAVLDQGSGGTHQAREERDVIVASSLRRLEELEIGDQALCFGRIDLAPPSPGDSAAGERFYIGRLAVWNQDQEPLVVDWRAPVAEPFYRATGRRPMGLTRRRHFALEGRSLVDMEDELFAVERGRVTRRPDRGRAADEAGGGPGAGEAASGAGAGEAARTAEEIEDAGALEHAELAGPAALLAALERSRSGHMRDIVATVQAEQDQVIRSPLAGVLVVQGGPGTGKTAVALHRAAYLLYTHRFPLERQGVLIVGPNPVFLRYIERVLPSLGETGVALTTIDGVYGGTLPRATETGSTAALKGDPRMAAVVAKAVADRQRPLRRDLMVRFGSTVLRIGRGESMAAVRAGRRRRGTHNSRRRLVQAALVRQLVEQYRHQRARLGTALGASSAGEEDEDGIAAELRHHPDVAAAMQRIWPRLLPEELLHDLYGSRPLIDLASGSNLDADEKRSLFRPRSRALDEIPWTSADIALLDEARAVLGPISAVPGDDGPRTYGHIVVDEAQDLSPMQLRMVARRSLSGSMTVVGDIGQATGPVAPGDWDEIVRHLPARAGCRVEELSVNYRTPAEVMGLAGRVLRETAPQLRPPRSVRADGTPPRMISAAAGGLGQAVAAAAAQETVAAAGGTVAVVAPRPTLTSVASALEGEGLPFGEAATSGLGAPLTLVPLELAKGLEFDAVIVAEPALVVEEAGLRALYVALTRPTRRLVVVNEAPLPAVLRA